MTEAVLLVDDRRENLLALEAILEPLELELVSVTSGNDALRELLKRDYAVIVLDVQMPGLDGFETAELIRSREHTKHVPILFVTAISKAEANVYRGYAAGAVDYLFKPVNPDILRSKVQTLVSLARRGRELAEAEEKLRERELAALRAAERQRYRELAEAMPQVVWVTDAAGRPTYYNRHWFELTGYDPQQPEHADWRRAVHPDDLAAAVQRRRETLATGDVFEVEYRFRTADGAWRWHLGRAVPVRNADGGIDHWVGTATDIHDQVRNAEMQRFLLQASTLLAAEIATRPTLKRLGELALPQLGDWCVVDHALDNGTFETFDVVHRDERKVALARELRLRYGVPGAAYDGDARCWPDIPLEEVATDELQLELLRDLDVGSSMSVPMIARGRILGALTFVRSRERRPYSQAIFELAQDLAQRAAIALDNGLLFREAEERAEAARVLATIGDGVVLVDDDGDIRLWNPAAARITGVPEEEAVGRQLGEAVPALRPLEREESSAARPYELPTGEVWLSTSIVRFDGGTVIAFRNQTDERAIEALRQDLVATVSHELRTPLAAIYGAAVTLRRTDTELDPELRSRLLEIVVDESSKLGEIVNDLLLASQIDAGRLQVSIEPCDPRGLAASVVEAARTHLPASTTVDLRLPETLPAVAADPGQLQQVLANLVDNAVKYSPDGGEIRLAVEARGDNVRFVVSDPGLGIPAAEQRRIFEKFYRLDPDMTQGIGGTGLGLYICRELVRRVGGRIWVESQEGEGSTFYVEVPVAPNGAGLTRSPATAAA